MTLLPELERQVRLSAQRTQPGQRTSVGGDDGDTTSSVAYSTDDRWPAVQLPTRPRRRWRRVGGSIAGLAVGVGLLTVLLSPASGGRAVPPADEQSVTVPAPLVVFAPAPDKIVYVRTRSVDATGSTSVTEEWHRGRENHRFDRWQNASEGNRRWQVEQLVDAEGVMRQINEEGRSRVIRRSDNEDAANVIAQRQAGFLADFRASAEKGTLDPNVNLEFAGRPARRFHVAPDTEHVTRMGPDQSYYFDRDTGEPLGLTAELKVGRANNWTEVMRVTQTVEAIEVLDPTSENLAKLRDFVLKRK